MQAMQNVRTSSDRSRQVSLSPVTSPRLRNPCNTISASYTLHTHTHTHMHMHMHTHAHTFTQPAVTFPHFQLRTCASCSFMSLTRLHPPPPSQTPFHTRVPSPIKPVATVEPTTGSGTTSNDEDDENSGTSGEHVSGKKTTATTTASAAVANDKDGHASSSDEHSVERQQRSKRTFRKRRRIAVEDFLPVFDVGESSVCA